MNKLDQVKLQLSRRSFLSRSSLGVGSLALASLLSPRLLARERETASAGGPQFRPRVRRVIWLYMAGGMSHLETWDHKPKLAAMHGKPMPESFTKGQPIAQLQGAKLNCFGGAGLICMSSACSRTTGKHSCQTAPKLLQNYFV